MHNNAINSNSDVSYNIISNTCCYQLFLLTA